MAGGGVRESWYRQVGGEVPPRPALTGRLEAGTCVIGGGLAGLGVALSLAERGRPCILLEAGRIGDGASGRNGGMASAGFTRGRAFIAARAGAEAADTLYRLSLDGVALLRRRIGRHASPAAWSRAWSRPPGATMPGSWRGRPHRSRPWGRGSRSGRASGCAKPTARGTIGRHPRPRRLPPRPPGPVPRPRRGRGASRVSRCTRRRRPSAYPGRRRLAGADGGGRGGRPAVMLDQCRRPGAGARPGAGGAADPQPYRRHRALGDRLALAVTAPTRSMTTGWPPAITGRCPRGGCYGVAGSTRWAGRARSRRRCAATSPSSFRSWPWCRSPTPGAGPWASCATACRWCGRWPKGSGWRPASAATASTPPCWRASWWPAPSSRATGAGGCCGAFGLPWNGGRLGPLAAHAFYRGFQLRDALSRRLSRGAVD